MTELEDLRSDFPIYTQQRNNKPPIYFDSACMTLRPESVINAIESYYREYSACAERSDHWFAELTEKKVQDAREAVSHFLQSLPENVVFTRNTTEGINLLAFQFRRTPGGVVIISDKEHNSNFLPWKQLEIEGLITLEIIPTTPDSGLDLEQLEQIVEKYTDINGPKLISVFHTSNLDGSENPISEIVSLAKKYGYQIHIDGAQGLPHKRFIPGQAQVDYLTFSGHKMLGPTGTGVFWATDDHLSQMQPMIIGGGTPLDATYDGFTLLKPPAKFEAGLQNYAGIIGLGAAVSYLDSLLEENPHCIHDHEVALNTYLTEHLIGLSDRITIIGPTDPSKRNGILSFSLKDMDHHQVSYLLNDQANIMIRAGRHCV
ncbi:aminotransferase class V-fold PLP-dependent enzyme, partial [candidate division WWE3 bacterium]|nr:aminotransferase class V-fold PLP-dependent enzyme [candidate division WWE3 bacterium]